MKNLCEHYVFEKLEKGRKYTAEAAEEEANGRREDSQRLLAEAKRQVESALRELNGDHSGATTIVDISDNLLSGLPDEQQFGLPGN